MRCLMCFSVDSKLQSFEENTGNEILKKITFVLPDFKIPESKDPICICAPCIEQVTYFHTIKKTSLQNCCHLKHFKAMLNVTNKMELNELNIKIDTNEISAQHQYSEFKVDPNHTILLSPEDEFITHIKEEAQEYDDYSQQLENDESSLDYLQDDESSNSDNSTQHHTNVGSYEFVDVTKLAETESNLTFNESGGSQKKRLKRSDDNKAFTKQTDSEYHPRAHTEQKSYKCLTCYETFKRRYNLAIHKLRKHSVEKPFECDVCHKKYNVKTCLNRHKLRHLNEKPHKCDVCPKMFSIKSELNRHKLIHSDEKPYECDVCHKAFSDKYDVKRHKHTHTGEKPHGCDVCLKTFRLKTDLTRHKLTHSSEKPYECDVCYKTFTDKRYLPAHKRMHNNVRPYPCTVCNKAFTQSSNLNTHMRTHTGEKPHQCHLCRYKCSSADGLKTHIRFHLGEKPYNCSHCELSFTTQSILKQHISRHHKNEQSN